MKKNIFVIIVIIILALTLTACGLIPKDGDTYDELNELVKKTYQSVNLEVQTEMNGVKLVSTFTSNAGSNNTIVTYSIEELATFSQMDDSDNWVIPEEMILKKTGSAVIKNGVIVETSGDPANIPVDKLQSLTIEFDSDYFTNAMGTYEGGAQVFKADVTDVKAFTGNQNFDGTNMKVTVRYNDALESIVIDYTTTKGATIKIIYTFR